MQPVSMPPFWESILKGYVKKTFYADTRRKDFADRAEFTEGDYRFFVKGVRDLSVAFTQERAFLPKNYLNQKEHRSGYILYFLPVNALKVATLLDQIPDEIILKNQPRRGVEGEAPTALPVEGATRAPMIDLTILDVGSGPGTGMLGTMLHLEKMIRSGKVQKLPVRLRWILIDQNRQALNDAAALHDLVLFDLRRRYPRLEISSELKLEARDLFAGKVSKSVPSADLILCLNVLSELAANRRRHLLEDLLGNVLKPAGRLLAMEPALQSTTRALMDLHDELLDRGLGHVHAPCLHQAACPMLQANDRDWCHTYIPWNRPPWIEKIDRLVSIRKDYLKCSYLLLGREAPARRETDLWRVVSGPLNSKGKSERLLCGEAGLPGLLRVCRLDRDESPANAAFDALERGDLVRMAKTARVTKETPLRKA
ncbi:MAG TPA: small ribosomal subunit Rsm22 family protein [bacterium]|nr:small ribosomal subunit Rsm22 family protein [bacterium]